MCDGLHVASLAHTKAAIGGSDRPAIDTFVNATQDEIRQVFRRINSYTVPLNPQEQRNAAYQGEFKWFMVDISDRYDQILKDIGTFSERQLTRMADVEFLAEIVMAMRCGLSTAAPGRLTKFYQENNARFLNAEETSDRLRNTFQYLIDWRELHDTSLMRPLSLYSLILAISHCTCPIEKLQAEYPLEGSSKIQRDMALFRLGSLAETLSDPSLRPDLEPFVDASSSGTNTKKNRTVRFRYFCEALRPVHIE